MEPFASIESLDAEGWIENQEPMWKEIVLASGTLAERYRAVVSQISANEILILGGQYGIEEGLLGDGYIFNIDSNSMRQVVEDSLTLRFEAHGNQSVMVRQGKVVGLVVDTANVARIIAYRTGSEFVDTVKKIGKSEDDHDGQQK